MLLADFDPIALLNLLKSYGLSGWILMGIVGLVIFLQYKSGNITNLWATIWKFISGGGLSLDQKVALAVNDHLDAIGVTDPPSRQESAYHSALDLIDYFESDPEGYAAAVKCGERLFHAKAPPING